MHESPSLEGPDLLLPLLEQQLERLVAAYVAVTVVEAEEAV